MGLVCLTVVAIGGGIGLVQLRMNPVTLGIILSALSGIGGLAGFFAAFYLRLRSWAAFGIRSTTWRWIMIGVGLGVVAFAMKGVAILGYISLTGDSRTAGYLRLRRERRNLGRSGNVRLP